METVRNFAATAQPIVRKVCGVVDSVLSALAEPVFQPEAPAAAPTAPAMGGRRRRSKNKNKKVGTQKRRRC